MNGLWPQCNNKKNYREIEKFTNIWNLHNGVPKKQWVKEEITQKIRKYIEINESKAHQNS